MRNKKLGDQKMAWPLKYKHSSYAFCLKVIIITYANHILRTLKKAKDKTLSLFCVCLVIMEICLQGKT